MLSSELLSKVKVPSSESIILLSFVAEKSKEFILAHPEFELIPSKSESFLNLCRRREDGVPLAYLTGHREFFGLDFFVDERVLIPRPETELLVEEALAKCDGLTAPRLCDVGTGSGCIAVALAKNLPQAHITAVDVSAGALEVAKKNALFHGVADRVQFLESDLLSQVSDEIFDAMVTNLPYIGESENHLVEREVLEHEPKVALFSGPSGLELYERLFQQISVLKNPPKFIIGEMGFLQRKALGGFIQGFFPNAKVEWKQDYAGLDRLFSIRVNYKSYLAGLWGAHKK